MNRRTAIKAIVGLPVAVAGVLSPGAFALVKTDALPKPVSPIVPAVGDLFLGTKPISHTILFGKGHLPSVVTIYDNSFYVRYAPVGLGVRTQIVQNIDEAGLVRQEVVAEIAPDGYVVSDTKAKITQLVRYDKIGRVACEVRMLTPLESALFDERNFPSDCLIRSAAR